LRRARQLLGNLFKPKYPLRSFDVSRDAGDKGGVCPLRARRNVHTPMGAETIQSVGTLVTAATEQPAEFKSKSDVVTFIAYGADGEPHTITWMVADLLDDPLVEDSFR